MVLSRINKNISYPEIKSVDTRHGHVTYMNSGDWIENLTALEYSASQWSIYIYNEDPVAQAKDINKKLHGKVTAKTMMASLMLEMNLKPTPMAPGDESVEAA